MLAAMMPAAMLGHGRHEHLIAFDEGIISSFYGVRKFQKVFEKNHILCFCLGAMLAAILAAMLAAAMLDFLFMRI